MRIFTAFFLKGKLMKLVLKDNTSIDIESYENKESESAVVFRCKDITVSDVIAKFTEANTAEVDVFNDLEEQVAKYIDYILGDKISYEKASEIVEVTLEFKSTKEAVVDVKSALQNLQASSTQNAEDIAAINDAIADLASAIGGE